MASLFSLRISCSSSSLSLPPHSQPRKPITAAESSSSLGCLKPIVVTGNPPTFVSAPGRRIVAVGDLHGDIAQTRSALEMAGVLSSDGRNLWTGGETVLVQLGDILDRGEDEIAILSLLQSLNIQAKDEGGAVFQLNGNHETMNVEGDFRYVHQGAFEECEDFLEHLGDYEDNMDEAFIDWISVAERRKQDRKMSESDWVPWKILKRQKGVIARSTLFKPGGPLACKLAYHPVILKVDDWVFCHGGLLPHHVAYGVERINRKVSNWMKGLHQSGENDPELPFIATRGYDSVVWNRLYSQEADNMDDYQAHQIYSVLQKTLQEVGGKAMVVGHTPQREGINCKYSCSIWRIDVGMSSGVHNSRPEVLEIIDNKARVIRGRTDMLTELHVVDYT